MRNADKKLKSKPSRGSVLVFTLIVLFIILATAIGIASVAVIERKTAGTTGKSAASFQVADSGAEIILQKIYKGSPSPTLISDLGNCVDKTISGSIGTGKDYKVTFWDNADPAEQLSCDGSISDVAKIKSVGTYIGTSRAIEVAVLAGDITEGLVGWWKLDDGSGSPTAADETSNNNDGTLNGPTWLTNGGQSGDSGDHALDFDGTNDWVRVDDDSSLDITNNLTITAWIEADSIGSGWYDIVFKGVSSPASANYQFAVVDSDRLGFDYYSGGSWRGDTVDDAITTDEWTFVAVTKDADGFTLYKNGSLLQSFSQTTPLEENGDPLGMGAVGSGDSERFDGTIDDVRIYDRTLSQGEVQQIYNVEK